MGLLSLLIITPLLGAGLIAFVPTEFGKAMKVIAMSVAVATMIMAISLYGQFDSTTFHFQLLEEVQWIPSLGINYLIGVDGISLWMVILTALLGCVGLAFSLYETRRVKQFLILFLLLEATMLGTFLSLDMILFYTFFEAGLFPMAFLIWIWGGEKRNVAAIRFFIYLFGGSIFMLVGMIALARLNQQASGILSFSIIDIQRNVANGSLWTGALGLEQLIFWSFAIAFLIKAPAFPFHTWLVDSYTEGPVGAVILGVLLKTGTYGLLRFCLPLFPDALPSAVPWILSLAVIGIIYGAVVACVQTDIKRLIAFSSLSHVGFVILGIFSLSYDGIIGGSMGQFSHGIATGSLFLLVGFLLLRKDSRDVRDFGGLKGQMPVFAALFLIASLAALGLPGTNAFIGEFLALLGSFESGFGHVTGIALGFAVVAAAGVILAAVYTLILFQRMFYGTLKDQTMRRWKDIKAWEAGVATVLIGGILWGGIYPKTFLQPMEASVNAVRMMSGRGSELRPAWSDKHQVLDNELNLVSDELGTRVVVAAAGLHPSQGIEQTIRDSRSKLVEKPSGGK